MKYVLRGKNDYYINPIETILRNRGIEDINRFLNLDKDVIHDWNLLNNINLAVDCLLKHISNNSNIFIQCDSDVDGICSFTILINYLKKIFPSINIQWRIHDGKEHGVIVDTIPNDVDLVIIPDAGSNQFKEHQILKERGMDIIVLDHHECEKESHDAIVVNNQLSPNYPNKNFSGAGIVYKFLKAVDSRLGIYEADYFLDLVALGNIADNMDMRELETRYYVLKGLQNINNTFFKALLNTQEFNIKGVINITNVAFYIAPLINATIRVGTYDEKIDMVKSFLESDEMVYYKRKDIYEPIQISTARQLVNIRNRQKKQRDQGVGLIEKRIKEKKLTQNKIMIVNVTDLLDKNLTGLVANQIAEKYKRPTLLVRVNERGNFSGSARANNNSPVNNFKQFLLDTGKFIMCEGHASAFGFEIEIDKLVEANAYINELLKDVEIDVDLYEVDFIIPAKQLNSNVIYEIAKLKDIWGFRVEEPLIVIKDLSINKDELHFMGKSNNTLKFIYKEIEFIKFFVDKNEIENKFIGENFVLDIVGRFSENEWDGVKKPQVIIDDFNIVKTQKKQLVF